jgi:hypothetical protein
MVFIARKPGSERHANHTQWVAQLTIECDQRTATDTGPIVIEEQVQGSDRLHVFAIWDEWREASEEHRSAAILDAYEQARGQEVAARVAVAMGLTKDEATAMGIDISAN